MFLLFIQITVAQFFAEMGDKTQLMLVAMTEKHKMADIMGLSKSQIGHGLDQEQREWLKLEFS